MIKVYGVIKKGVQKIKIYGCVCSGTNDEDQARDGNNNDIGSYGD